MKFLLTLIAALLISSSFAQNTNEKDSCTNTNAEINHYLHMNFEEHSQDYLWAFVNISTCILDSETIEDTGATIEGINLFMSKVENEFNETLAEYLQEITDKMTQSKEITNQQDRVVLYKHSLNNMTELIEFNELHHSLKAKVEQLRK